MVRRWYRMQPTCWKRSGRSWPIRQRAIRRQTRIQAAAERVRTSSSEPQFGLADRLVERLGPEPLSIDELVRQCDATVADVQDALVDLELEGRLERHPGNRVALRLD